MKKILVAVRNCITFVNRPPGRTVLRFWRKRMKKFEVLSSFLKTGLSVFFLVVALVSCDNTGDNQVNDLKLTSSKAIIQNGIVVHFEKPDSWSSAYIWFDQHSDGTWETTQAGQAPGDMTQYRSVDGKDWYKKEFTDTSSVIFLFNKGDWSAKVENNGANFSTTADIWVRSDGSYTLNDPHGDVEDLTVYFKKPVDWNAPNIYSWTGSGSSAIKHSGEWPGNDMEIAPEEGANWYKYTISGQGSCNIIFNDGTKQTVNLSRSEKGFFVITGEVDGKYTGEWSATNPDQGGAPSIVISPEGKDFSAAPFNVNIKITSSNTIVTRTITKTINSSAPVVEDLTSNDENIDLSTLINVGDTISLQVYAKDDQNNETTSNIQTYTYKDQTGMTVYFKKPSDWSAPNAYAWNAGGTLSKGWPGDGMELAPEEGNDWYKYTVDGESSCSIIFNAGSKQTVNLSREGNGYFVITGQSSGKYTGKWYNENPDNIKEDFSWDNATIYFVMTDRFNNGEESNDNSYGRRNNYGGGDLAVGTFHGGDIKGLTEKLDYLDEIGVNAIWITAAYEQMHGFCSGGNEGKFPHYGYHGYYGMDYTMMDKNMGTEDDMRNFVKAAHAKGIRVIMDIVMNHLAYNTALDGMQYNYGGNPYGKTEQDAINWTPGQNGKWWDFNNEFFDFNSHSAWNVWFGSDWVRAGLPGYDFVTENADVDALKCNLNSLPDIKTESTGWVNAPSVLKRKWASENTTEYESWIIDSAANLRQDLNAAPSDYMVKWLAAWVEEFGFDGFRCDTAKHVDMYRWKQLKDACKVALNNWRNSSRSDGDAGKGWTDDFWMTGEHWDFNAGGPDHVQAATQGSYFDNGFDNMIDFGYKKGIPGNYSELDGKFYWYQDKNYLPYISSHDTGSVYYNGDAGRQKWAGTCLLLNSSPVQIYYGDEIGRSNGNNAGDPNQGSRSDFEWDKVNANNDILNHWKKLGKFRQNHVAIGAGTHAWISNSPYTFSRTKGSDKVVVSLGGSGSVQVDVSSVFTNGTTVRNAYTGTTAVVTNGKATFNGDVILIEQAE